MRTTKGLSYILWRWKEWAGEDAVRQWLDLELRDESDALWILGTFLSTMSSSSNGKTTYIRYVDRDALRLFTDMEKISDLTNHIELAKLSTEDMRSLRAFRLAIIWEAEGKPKGYRGESSDGTNPLEEDS